MLQFNCVAKFDRNKLLEVFAQQGFSKLQL